MQDSEIDHLAKDIKQMVFESGSVGSSEIGLLRHAIDRYGVNETLALLLLDLNNVLSEGHTDAFADLFVEVVAAFVLDGTTQISADKWNWLEKNLLKDGVIDSLERQLLTALKQQATNAPTELDALLAR